MIKILHITRDTRKTLKRGKQEKRRVQDKFDDVTTTIEFLPSDFYGKGYILLEKHSLGKCILYYYISSNVF